MIKNVKTLDTVETVLTENLKSISGEISSDLYRASLCDIKKSKVKPFELERNQ